MNPAIETPDIVRQNQGNETGAVSTVLPRIDILETKDEVQVWFELPGVEPSGLQLEVHQEELHLLATPSNPPGEGARCLLRERKPVQYKRHLRLADTLDQAKIWAEQIQGVLKIHLPKKAEVQRRKIEVRQA